MRTAPLLERDQTRSVSARVSSFGQHGVVTSHLTFHRDTLLNPPHRWMKEKYSAHDFLYEICPVIPAPQVREFVQQDDVQILSRQFSQRPSRQDNGPLPKPDGGRHAHEL